MKNIIETLKAHKVITLYIIAFVVIVFLIYGCQPKVESLFTPDVHVGREELLAEVDLFIARAQARLDTLEQKERFLRAITDFTAVSLQTGQVNPSGLFVTLLSILGAGTIGNYAGKAQIRNELKDKRTPQQS